MSFCGLANIIMIRISYFYVQCTRVNFATETFRFANGSEMVIVHDKQESKHVHIKKSKQTATNDKKGKHSSNRVSHRTWYIIKQFGSTSRNYCLNTNSINIFHNYIFNINHFNKYQNGSKLTSIFNQILNINYLINY